MAHKLKGAAPAGLYAAKTIAGEAVEPQEAIFLIFGKNPDGTMEPIGTGFFIADNGVFVTAAHVVHEWLDENGAPRGEFGIVQFLPDGVFVLRPIMRATCHLVADVAVGVAAPMHKQSNGDRLTNRLMPLATAAPPIGARVCTFAFPKPEYNGGPPHKLNVAPDYFEGRLVASHPQGRDRTMLPGPCFETTMVLHGAASGGPVFDELGRVFAVNSTGWGDSPISYVSDVSVVAEMSLDNIIVPGVTSPRSYTVRQLADLGLVHWQ